MVVANNTLTYELNISDKFDFTEGGPLLLLDGDPFAYSAASVCDTTTYKLYLNNKLTYEVEGGVKKLYSAFSVKNKKAWDELLERNPDITVEKAVVADADPKQMFHTIKKKINTVIKRTKAGSIRIFLTDGKSNFRLTENIATVLKYKGNRSSESKPNLLGEARDYMENHLGSEMCVGLEADDKLSILHYDSWQQAMKDAEEFYMGEECPLETLEKKAMELSKTILGTIDKDIKSRAGKFINPDQDIGIEEIYPMGHLHLEIKKRDNKPDKKKLHFSGLKGFYAQILKGDDCDNIPNVLGCGDVGTYEALKECKTEKELFQAVLSGIYEGIHREHVSALDEDVKCRVEAAVGGGASGSAANRTKLRKKFKDYLLANVQYRSKKYYHWSCYVEQDDGIVTRELKSGDHSESEITPIEYMKEVARLVYMLTVDPDEDGSHLWQPNSVWADEVQAKYVAENLTRVDTSWVLPNGKI